MSEADSGALRRSEGAPLRILVVEDDTLMRLVLEGELADQGAEILVGTDRGELAVELASIHHPDLIVMDISLKGPMDGVTAAEAILRRFNVPVVFLSGNADALTRGRIAALDGPELIAKPPRPGALAAAIRRACNLVD